jgi:hypothetical protein
MRIFKCSTKLIIAFKVSVTIGLGLFSTESARADTVLLSLTDIGYTETLYNLDFMQTHQQQTFRSEATNRISYGWPQLTA